MLLQKPLLCRQRAAGAGCETAPPAATHPAGTGVSHSQGAQELASLQRGSKESGFSGCPGIDHLDLSELLILLPHPACCAHKGLEMHNSFQDRGEKLSARQGYQDLQWGWS